MPGLARNVERNKDEKMKAKKLDVQALLPVPVKVDLIDGYYYCNPLCREHNAGGRCHSGNLDLDKSNLLPGRHLCRAECHVAADAKELKDES